MWKYYSILANTIEASNEISAGTEEEVELRACSIYAVEKMRVIEYKITKAGRAELFYIFLFHLCGAILNFTCMEVFFFSLYLFSNSKLFPSKYCVTHSLYMYVCCYLTTVYV